MPSPLRRRWKIPGLLSQKHEKKKDGRFVKLGNLWSSLKRQKTTYLFFKGDETGKKANGLEVATRMRTLRTGNGERMFGKTGELTEQEITRYFSKLSALDKSGQLQREEIASQVSDEEGDDVDDLVAEADMVQTRRQIRRDLEL